MLYLSRLILNLRDRNVRRDLADVQQLHRTILNAFPAVPEDGGTRAREYFGVLFRAEPLPDQPLAARVLVQSNQAPDWTYLLTGYLAPSLDGRPNPAVRQLDDYDRIAAGMPLRFRLRANPTQRIGKNNLQQGEKWRGKRVELRQETDQIAWLQRKAEQGGFRLLTLQSSPGMANVRVSPQAKVMGDRHAAAKMTFGAAVFEGLLEVQDPERFRQTLVSGIGSGKAYGFGLLSIATIH